MWPRVEFIWLPISPGIKYLYLALVTAGFLSERQRLCPQTHVGNESAHSRLELSPRCAHCKKYPPERLTSAGFTWTDVQDKVLKWKRQNQQVGMSRVAWDFVQIDMISGFLHPKSAVADFCPLFLRMFHRKSPPKSATAWKEGKTKSAHLNFVNEMEKGSRNFLGETSPNMDIFCSAHPEPLRVNGPLTCTQFMGSKPQETASCLSFTIPCCFLFVFAAHMCKNSPLHLCWGLNYTEFFHLFYFLFVFSWALLCAAYRRDCSGAKPHCKKCHSSCLSSYFFLQKRM